MGSRQFICYKAYNSIDLKNAATGLGLPSPEGRSRYIVLHSKHLAQTYNDDVQQKRIYIFNIGCIVFEGFGVAETRVFLKDLESIIGKHNYKTLTEYREIHSIISADGNMVYLWEGSTEQYPLMDGLSEIVAVILAKSTALSKEESDINQLLDKADSHISKYQKGILSRGTRSFALTMAQIIKFEHRSTVEIRIFDRPTAAGSIQLREAYDKLSVRFELDDRYSVLESKVAELRNITHTYSTLKYRLHENRLIGFEIFLLILFPLFRIFDYIIGQEDIKSFFRMIFPHLLQKLNIFY